MLSHVVALAFSLAQLASPHNERSAGVPIGQGTSKPSITINSPSGGWTVDRMILVEGSVSDSTVDPISLSINGDRYLLRTIQGRFSRKFPAAAGKNVVTVMASNQGGTSYAQTSTFAQIPPVPLKLILTSDTDGVYTDLHIYEPTQASTESFLAKGELQVKQMAHVYWANTASPSGGTFFLNSQGGDFDQPGYGPYLYIHRAPPQGIFAISANYWPSGDKAHTVGTLNISLFEGTAAEIRRKVQIPLATPGTTRVLAWIRVFSGNRALVYIPSSEPLPQGTDWPSNFQKATQELTSSSN